MKSYRRAALRAVILSVALWTGSPAFSADDYETLIQPFLKTYCVGCHGPDKQQSDLRLDTLQPDFSATGHAETWIEVMDNLNLGEMPPADARRPDTATHERIVRWIAEELRLARRKKAGAGGRAPLRRMNRTEYSNTIRDLFQMRFLPGEDPVDDLPPDAAYDGFDKVGSALMLDSSLLGNYYEAARAVAERAIVDGPPPFATHLSHFEMEEMAKKGSGFSYMCSGSTTCGDHDVRLLSGSTRTARGLLYPGTDQMIPAKGWYTIRVRASGDRGEEDEPVKMFVERMNGREGRIMEVEVTAPRSAPEVYSVTLPLDALPEARGVYMKVGIINGAKRLQPRQLQDPERAISVGLPDFFTFEAAMKAAASMGDHAESLRIAARRRSEGWTGSTRPGKGLLDPTPLRKLYVDWIEIEGPLYDQWPPRSHKALFFRGESAPHTIEYAREMFTRFMPKAFRRPVEAAEVDRIVTLIQAEIEQGTEYRDAIRLGITSVLTSPHFLYLAEPQATAEPRPLNDYELASRLSYFFWSSMPDDRLFELAAAGRLTDPAVLSAEVNRMLDDPKSDSLVDGFARQWLKTDEFLEFIPDRRIYPDFHNRFDPTTLRESMQQETLEFFREILRKDLSVLNFVDSDFVMVNQELAEFYGLPGVKGPEFRRVPLPPEAHRGGLLGQGGVHLRGSDGVRTRPVSRGVYVREVLFNDPPGDPPPNVGEVEPNIQGENLTVRQRLIQHQQIEACASCHRGIDPYGLALENFDVTGAWRDRQNGEDFRGRNTPPIDTSGELPNGRAFNNFAEFKSLLLEQDDRFRRALVEKLFLYALGRPAMPADRGTIDEVVAGMQQNGDSLRAAMQALTATGTFRTKQPMIPAKSRKTPHP